MKGSACIQPIASRFGDNCLLVGSDCRIWQGEFWDMFKILSSDPNLGLLVERLRKVEE